MFLVTLVLIVIEDQRSSLRFFQGVTEDGNGITLSLLFTAPALAIRRMTTRSEVTQQETGHERKVKKEREETVCYQ